MESRRRTADGARGRAAGVSLLAVLVTLAGIALVAGLAIPAFFDRHGVTLDNACVLVARDLRVAQTWAAYSQTELAFVFEADGDGYRVVDAQGRTVVRPDQKGEFARRFSADGVFDGVRLERIEFGPERSVVFGRSGKASRGGTLLVGFREQHRRLALEADSGHVSVEGLEPEWEHGL